MRNLPIRSLCLCLAFAFVAGCGTDALHIPPATQVSALQIDNNRGVDSETRSIDDPATVSEFMSRIDAWADRWEQPRGKLPDAQYRIFLNGNYASGKYAATVTSGQVIVFLGEDWVAAREVWEHSAPTRMVSVSAAEMADVHRLLGIPQ